MIHVSSSRVCLRCGSRLEPRQDICAICKTSKQKPVELKFELGSLGCRSCLACDSKRIEPVMFIYHVGIPPGQKEHKFIYRHVVIIRCQDCGNGHIESHDHDCYSYEEVWDRDEWYLLDSEDISRLEQFKKPCPNPQSSLCACRIHNSLRAAIYELPRKGWEGFSEELKHVPKDWREHIHQIIFDVKDGLPTLKAK